MKILQLGMAKSGNYWLYQIIRNIMEHFQLPDTGFIRNQPVYKAAKTWYLNLSDRAARDEIEFMPMQVRYKIGAIFRMPIHDLDEYMDQVTHVWCETSLTDAAHEIMARFDRSVNVVRDGRDVAISWAHYALGDYMLYYTPRKEQTFQDLLDANLERMLNIWVRNVSGYIENAGKFNIHMVQYEHMLEDFESVATGLLEYLGLERDAEFIEELKKKTSFGKMKAKHAAHCRVGKSEQWREVLTEEQKRMAKEIAGQWLQRLGYEI